MKFSKLLIYFALLIFIILIVKSQLQTHPQPQPKPKPHLIGGCADWLLPRWKYSKNKLYW